MREARREIAADARRTYRAYRAHSSVTRDAVLADVRAHAAAGRYDPEAEAYWMTDDGTGCDTADDPRVGRGSLIGATNVALNARLGERLDIRDEGLLSVRLGVPAGVLDLAEAVFEHVAPEEVRDWPVRFYSAIADGADLSAVWPRMARWILLDPAYGLRSHVPARVRGAVEGLAVLYVRELAGATPSEWRWHAALDRGHRHDLWLCGHVPDWAARDASVWYAYAGPPGASRSAWYRACAERLLATLRAMPGLEPTG